MISHTKIEWVRNIDGSSGYSWNPIKGPCPVNCKTPDGKSYCYARKIYRRFMKKYFLEGENDRLVDTRELFAPLKIKKPSRIFVCSTYELFHPAADFARNEIFDAIKENPRHTFIILTKMPERIDRPMPDNVWLGVSVTGEKNDDDRIRFLCNGAKARVKFVSFEPLLGDVSMRDRNAFPGYAADLSWVIVGRLTGHGHRFDPTQANIKRIYQECRTAGIPIFLKNNLRGLWKRPFVQEFPMETCT